MGRGKSYSVEEDTYIKENYRDLFDNEMALILGRPEGSITRRRQRLGCWYVQQELTTIIKGEVWINIKGLPSNYYISNMGRVKTGNKLSALFINKAGYVQWRVVNKSKLIAASYKVHRLVAEHFLIKPDKILLEVHHKDKNSLNNRFDNLLWVTRQEHIDLHR